MVSIALILAAAAGGDDTVKLKLIATGGMPKVGYYAPQRVALSDKKPDSITKLPDGLTAASFGVLPMKGPDKAVFHVVVDEPEGKPATLYVDSNGNGDLTDDGKADWAGRPGQAAAGQKAYTMYSGGATVKLGGAFDAHVAMYRFDKTDPSRAALKDTLLYYRDYVAEGEIRLGDKSYKVLLSDESARGDFRGEESGEASGVNLLIDVNGNGKFESRGESYDVRKPFNIGGTTWELRDIAKDGTELKVVKSEKKVDEVLPPPDHSVGKKITAFEAKTMDGKTLKFPGDYKGKVVMLDFWATWCGPCMREMPNVVANYEKYHGKGFEILGITLDNKDAEKKIADTMGQAKMTWTQVYDGGGWKAAIAQLYVINSIPRAFLVDGDTGEILDDGGGLRAEALGKSIEKALARKAEKK
jgi:thiol-disulfide isomerase/thioredoxin